MTRQKLNRLTAFHESAADESAALSTRLTAGQIEKLAGLVANGESPLPSDLLVEDLAKLLVGVARRRRTQLVQFIASTIAHDIARSRGPLRGD